MFGLPITIPLPVATFDYEGYSPADPVTFNPATTRGAPAYSEWFNQSPAASPAFVDNQWSGQSAAVAPRADVVDTIKTSSEAPRTRDVTTLEALVRAGGGKLTTTANSSEMIVAINNPLRFSIKKLAGGQYEISGGEFLGGYLPYILGGLGLVVALSMLKK